MGNSEQLDRPIILLARGGSGSRLLTAIAADLGIFCGNEINESGDALEMVQSVYGSVLRKYSNNEPQPAPGAENELRSSAGLMRASCPGPKGPWGFKLPENMLVLPELDAAFPEARYVHLVRDPLTTCLRRTHMTARLNDPVGAVTVPAAYRHCGVDAVAGQSDSPALHMAYTTIHQLEMVLDYADSALQGRYLELRFEQLVSDPTPVLKSTAGWLGLRPQGDELAGAVDPARPTAGLLSHPYPAAVVYQVEAILQALRIRLGYLPQ